MAQRYADSAQQEQLALSDALYERYGKPREVEHRGECGAILIPLQSILEQQVVPPRKMFCLTALHRCGAGRSTILAAPARLDERDRASRFPHIAFRDSATGREAFLRGHRLAVWQIVSAARALGGDRDHIARHFCLSPDLADEALAYAARYPEEIESDLQYVESFDLDRLRTFVPNAESFEARARDSRR